MSRKEDSPRALSSPSEVFAAVASRLGELRRIPVSTYRLQINFGFGFRQAREIVPYLDELGITDLYLSPCFLTGRHSLSGYDILRPDELNPEAGTEQDHAELAAELEKRAMGQILDIVPNHLSIAGNENTWWMDVLENGPSSAFADFFDIDWNPADERHKNRLLLPILGDQYGRVLENQEFTLDFVEGSFVVRLRNLALPLDPCSYSNILNYGIEKLKEGMGADHPGLRELLSIVTAIDNLPPYAETAAEKIAERRREKEIVKKRLFDLSRESAEVSAFISGNLAAFNGAKGNAGSFDLLDRLLDSQVYSLCHWRVAGQEINYRRFFDINDLAAVKEENDDVFRAMHALVFRLVREKSLTGLRVDHLDGLYDPAEYFRRLQRGCFAAMCLREAGGRADQDFARAIEALYDERARGEAAGPLVKPFYVIAEKILLRGEDLRAEWAILGTTGYTFLNAVNGIFIDPRSARPIDSVYARFSGSKASFAEELSRAKKLVMRTLMASELNTLGHRLSRITRRDRHTRDFPRDELTEAIVETIAAFSVYRTYASRSGIDDQDKKYVEQAVSRARRRNPALSSSLFDYLEDILLLRDAGGRGVEESGERLSFVMRFQQLTGPIMAKALEDTACYAYNRFVSLNEVGGSPDRFGLSLEAFHGQNIELSKNRPFSLLATSTHDTKRSEDARARLDVLSETPDEWRRAVFRWGRMNRRHKTVFEGQRMPDRNDEYLLYQALVSVWPLAAPGPDDAPAFAERIKSYMIKAAREAKVHTSWISPAAAYEEALLKFVDALLDRRPDNAFVADLERFAEPAAYRGALNSLSQTLLKIGAPGVPDFYQGTEIWDLSLVDPDNRRPVDFALRRRLLGELRAAAAARGEDLAPLARELLASWRDGRVKLYLTYVALNHRRRRSRLFAEGAYLPLPVAGAFADRICAFARLREKETAVVVVPRLLAPLASPDAPPLGEVVWQDTRVILPGEIADDLFRNVFTGESLEVVRIAGTRSLPAGRLLASFPCALLEPMGVESPAPNVDNGDVSGAEERPGGGGT